MLQRPRFLRQGSYGGDRGKLRAALRADLRLGELERPERKHQQKLRDEGKPADYLDARDDAHADLGEWPRAVLVGFIRCGSSRQIAGGMVAIIGPIPWEVRQAYYDRRHMMSESEREQWDFLWDELEEERRDWEAEQMKKQPKPAPPKR